MFADHCISVISELHLTTPTMWVKDFNYDLIMFLTSLLGSTHIITPVKYLKHLQHQDFLDPNAAPEDQLPEEDNWWRQEKRSDLYHFKLIKLDLF